MLNKIDLNIEKPKEALEKSVRAITGIPELTINFSAQIENPYLDNNTITLPEITSFEQISYVTGLADSIAFKIKFNSHEENKYIDRLLEARAETLGIQIYGGTKKNILAKINTQYMIDENAKLLYLSLHHYLNNFSLTSSEEVLSFVNKHKNYFEELKRALNNHELFKEKAQEFISELKIEGVRNKTEKEAEENTEKIETFSHVPSNSTQTTKGDNPPSSFTWVEGNNASLPQFLDDKILNYKIFTHEFDQEVYAGKLESADKLKVLRKQLDYKIASISKQFEKRARKFKHKLWVKKFCKWETKLENGVLNSKQLATVIADPKQSNIFKRFREDNLNDTVITLLIDNSGSMRGNRIAIAAILADLLSKTLYSLQIKVEVLGFTTLEWKGGKSFRKWLNTCSPNNPGRLNSILHITYKKAYESARKAARNFALMLKDGLLKENIDGEALKWAAEKILKHPQKRKILIIISDGAPLDEVTVANNKPNYLTSHLKDVISRVEKMPIELLAIGIGHDIKKYYKNSVYISNAEQLGTVLFDKLGEMMK